MNHTGNLNNKRVIIFFLLLTAAIVSTVRETGMGKSLIGFFNG
jgi:hypothetical protein